MDSIHSPFQLTYIWHDCFLIQTETANFIFDYFVNPDGKDYPPRFLEMADNEKPLFVVVSHHHKDHYNSEIFKWCEKLPQVYYVISKDVARHARHIITPGTIYNGPRPKQENIYVLKPGENSEISGIEFTAFASTDIGNSWMIEVDGLKIFHAGDLNAWIWKDESTPQEVNKALGDYKAIIKEIAKTTDYFDIVMFPVDSRIGTDYFTGAKMFLEEFSTHLFLPMHFCLGETPEQQNRFRQDAAEFSLYKSGKCRNYAILSNPYDSILHSEKR